jgi:cell wall-associated NlpC family hydrolase
MSAAECAVAAARGAVGARFRLHGRDPAFGLDCVGLAALAMRAAGYAGAIPGGYAIRGANPAAAIDAAGLVRVGDPAPGDVLLFAAGPGQFHLAVMVPGGIVHADAMLRRVVERPGRAPWPLVAAWRHEIGRFKGD